MGVYVLAVPTHAAKKKLHKQYHAQMVRLICWATPELIGHTLQELIQLPAPKKGTSQFDDWPHIVAKVKRDYLGIEACPAKKCRQEAAPTKKLLALVEWEGASASQSSFEPLGNIISDTSFLCQWNQAWSAWWDECIGDEEQMVVLARWLNKNPQLSFLEQPMAGWFRGIGKIAVVVKSGDEIASFGLDLSIAPHDPRRRYTLNQGIQLVAKTLQSIEGQVQFVWENYEKLHADIPRLSWVMGHDRSLLNLYNLSMNETPAAIERRRLFHSFMLGSVWPLELGQVEAHFEAGKFNVRISGKVDPEYFESLQYRREQLIGLSSRAPRIVSPGQLHSLRHEDASGFKKAEAFIAKIDESRVGQNYQAEIPTWQPEVPTQLALKIVSMADE